MLPKEVSSSLDEVDVKLLLELAKNARTTYRSLSSIVKLTDVAVMKRIKKLERRGVIKKYTVIVDPAALGYTKISFTGINVKPEKLFDVVRELREKGYVKYLAITSGDHDILAVIWARSADELEKVHEEIKRIDGVIAIYPMILSEKIKDELYV